MNFLTEPMPERGVARPVAPGIRRLVADNPGPMTYRGTNTYLIDWDGGVAVLDPGPDDAAHTRHIIDAAGAPIRALILTHGHRDHIGGLPALRTATAAPVYAWPGSAAAADVALQDGTMLGEWRAVHTPGHAADHLCFAGPGGVTFSGDHVMSWSSTVVAGEGSDMAAYVASLERLLALDATLYLPGHGPPLPDPAPFVRALLRRRLAREQAILAALAAGPASAAALTAALYGDLDPALAGIAEANVAAHLGKLAREGRATPADTLWTLTPPG